MTKSTELAHNGQKKYENMEEFWRDYDSIEGYLDEQGKDTDSYQKLIKLYGTNIKYFREAAGMSQQKLAKLLNMSVPSLNQIESGKRKSIDPNYVYKIASILSCSPDNLLNRATKCSYIWDAKGKKEIYSPFLFGTKYGDIDAINRGLLKLYNTNLRLYKILTALLSTGDPRTYERMADLLWATFNKELESMGLTRDDFRRND